MKNKVKFAIIGAGSMTFSPVTLTDILLNKNFASIETLEVYLMDIREDAVQASRNYCQRLAEKLGVRVLIRASTNLLEAVEGADFVITAIEVDRYHYWSQDFHIPRRYGFRQIYGENGGPGGMFHTLRNLPPMLEIARAMEKGCPGALMLNYTNPEAKLVEGVCRLTKINAVGLCHGIGGGMHTLGAFLEMPVERIGAACVGINHFGWFTRIWDKETGEDLYPKLREKEKQAHWLAGWDDLALTRILLRTYGLWSYPGASHSGEYLAWGDGFLPSVPYQFFFDPASERPWEPASKRNLDLIGSLSYGQTSRDIFSPPWSGEEEFLKNFDIDTREWKVSEEFAIPIAEAVFFDKPTEIGAVNVPNKGYAKDLPEDMVLELPAIADGRGLHPVKCDPLPAAVASMISVQGTIHKLVIEAYVEQSRNKLLQAVLLDPTVSSYHNAVAMIDEMCERQKEILPPMFW